MAVENNKDWLKELAKDIKESKKNLNDFLLSEKDFIALDLPKVDWIFDRLIPKPALIALTGRPGSYKTFFAHWIARRASLGLPLFDHYDDTPEWNALRTHKPIKTLLIQEEMGAEIMQERMSDLKQGDSNSVYWIVGADFSLKDKEKMEELVNIVEEKGIEMVILDPFSTVAHMKDENDNAEAAKIMDTILNKLVNNGPKITVIFLHHPSKSVQGGDAIRGAGDILGKSYIQYVLEKENYDSTRIKVKCPKHRWKQIRSFEMEMIESDDPKDLKALIFVYRGNEGQINKKNQEQMSKDILSAMWKEDQTYKKGQIAQSLEVDSKDQMFLNAWEKLENEGKICKVAPYRYKKTSQ